MAIIKTYYVGEGALVKRRTGLTGVWEDISLSTKLYNFSAKLNLHDVKTPSTDKDKVFVVGQCDPGNGYSGIYVSPDGGDTWNIPGGDYNTVTDNAFNWNEVSVVDEYVIYVAGDNGYVCKSIDRGNSFNLCARVHQLPEVLAGAPTYQHCKSLHFTTELIGVVGLKNNIVFTLDGGSTWLDTCGGNGIEGITPTTPNPGYIGGIQLNSTTSAIIAVGANCIVRTNNSGITFDNVYTWLAGSNGLHLSWSSDYYLYATGQYGERVKSTDAGLTWTNVGSFNINYPDINALQYYKFNTGFFSIDNILLYTSDAGTNANQSDVSLKLIKAVWTYYEETPCYVLTDCDNELEPIVVNNDFAAYVGDIVKICNFVSTPTIIRTKATTNSSFILRDCCGRYPDINVLADLAQYSDTEIPVYIPSLSAGCWKVYRKKYDPLDIPIDILGTIPYESCDACKSIHPCPGIININGCKCFQISISNTCRNAITITYESIYSTCEQCLTPCYLLTNCENNQETITTYTDLVQYLGTTIKLGRCPNKCWAVTEAISCDDAVCVSDVINYYSDCAACLPPVAVAPVQPINYRIVKPGYYTGTCDVNYFERVNFKFAEAIYKEMAVNRFGISACCDIELDKWLIKKELIELGSIYDESLCQSVICCPPCDVTAELFYF